MRITSQTPWIFSYWKRLYRKEGEGNFKLIKEITEQTTRTWTDTQKLDPQKSYSYYIVTYTINRAGKRIYAEHSDVLTVSPSTTEQKQVITAPKSVTKNYGDKAFSLNASCLGGAPLTYTSSNKNVVTVQANGQVSIVGAGHAYVTVTAAKTGGYESASVKVDITVKPISIANKKYRAVLTCVGDTFKDVKSPAKYFTVMEGTEVVSSKVAKVTVNAWVYSGQTCDFLSREIQKSHENHLEKGQRRNRISASEIFRRKVDHHQNHSRYQLYG